jgi:hypothetical protein
MTDAIRAIRPWLTSIGCVLVVGLLCWGQAIIARGLAVDGVPAHSVMNAGRTARCAGA